MIARYLRFPGGKAKALTFSYDDGIEEDIRLIEIFRKHGLRGTFNINSGMFGPEDGSTPPDRKHRRMSRSEVTKIYTDDLCEVACHCKTHANLPACDSAVACMDILTDRQDLEALFNRQIHGMAYPYGAYSDSSVDVCRNCGIYYARTTVSTLNFDMPSDWLRLPATCHHKNPKLNELADRFLTLEPRHDPKLFYVWGHTYEFADNNNWELIEAFAEKMAGRNDIWYATNLEIYNAWADYQQLQSSADGHQLFNPTCRSIWISDANLNTYEIKPGVTLHLK